MTEMSLGQLLLAVLLLFTVCSASAFDQLPCWSHAAQKCVVQRRLFSLGLVPWASHGITSHASPWTKEEHERIQTKYQDSESTMFRLSDLVGNVLLVMIPKEKYLELGSYITAVCSWNDLCLVNLLPPKQLQQMFVNGIKSIAQLQAEGKRKQFSRIRLENRANRKPADFVSSSFDTEPEYLQRCTACEINTWKPNSTTEHFAQPLSIGLEVQPLVDNFMIRTIQNGSLVQQEMKKLDKPVLVRDRPWEDISFATMLSISILHDGSKFRLWYRATW